MDPRLLEYYNRELQYIREMAAEFAQEHPKIAGRLDLRGLECADPYVERLLEGFAFLAARVQLKLDGEFPRVTQHLLEVLCPQYLAPTPSMALVQLQPSASEGGLADGYVVARDAVLRSRRGRGGEAPCEYRTAHDVTLWPIELAGASHAPYAPDLAGAGALAGLPDVRAALRLRLRATAGLHFDKIAADSLVFHLRGSGDVPARLYEAIVGNGVGLLVRGSAKAGPWAVTRDRSFIRRVGYDDGQALLPSSRRAFHGYRLLHEYFAFPERFLFVELAGLREAFRRCEQPELDLVVLLGRNDGVLNNLVDAGNFALYCTPAANVFPMQADTIHLSDRQHEYHVVPDRTRPLDFEVYDLLELVGSGSGDRTDQEFLPFYTSRERALPAEAAAFYTTRRVPRALSGQQKSRGPRSSYVGSEVFVSLVDADDAPLRTDLRQLALRVRCTNRDLPIHLSLSQGGSDFTLQAGAPVDAVVCLAGPSSPSPSFAEGELTWRLIGHLSLNYLTLADSEDGRGAEALRELLSLYAPVASATILKQIEGVRSVQARPVVRRIRGGGPAAFGRGTEVAVAFDEAAFTGSGVFLLGAVLDEFFARYTSINSFTETVISSTTRGELIRWPARSGRRHLL
ncbi:MAG: type VI secretion system baseplate subunit TssF [Acidobacteria bacterium]|nr:type VI secretion system baseplate subunit TssF [Acidobacteriota bacterium]